MVSPVRMKRKASAGSFGGLLAKCEAGGRVAGFALKTPFATAARAGPGAVSSIYFGGLEPGGRLRGTSKLATRIFSTAYRGLKALDRQDSQTAWGEPQAVGLASR
jgi:hypothetical protein